MYSAYKWNYRQYMGTGRDGEEDTFLHKVVFSEKGEKKSYFSGYEIYVTYLEKKSHEDRNNHQKGNNCICHSSYSMWANPITFNDQQKPESKNVWNLKKIFNLKRRFDVKYKL